MKKIFSLTAIIVLSVFALSTCYMGSEILSFQFYNEQNRNGFQVVELIPGALPGGNLHRLSFGVSSRQVHEGVLVNTGGRGGNITPWGCVIRDTMDIYDIAFKEAMAARFPASPDERRIQITAINETNNAGKIAGSEDGIAFYFVEVDKETNFRLSADFYIENYGFTRGRADHNGQEAFGIMARDFIPLYEDNGGGHSSTMDVLKTVNWNGVYWNGQDTSLNDGVGGSSNMIMVGGVKRGARVYWRTGVEDPAGLREPIEDPSAIADASFARFHFLPREFVDYSMYGTGQDGLERRPDFPSAGLTYKLMLEKTNSGFIARIEPPSGIGKGVTKDREIKDGEILHYTDRELPFPDLLFEVEKNLYYVGFFASRDARVIISNIRYEESPVHMCPPRVDLEPERFLPTFAVQSPSEVSTSDYILYARSNVEGYMALSINGGESIIYEGEWIIEPTNASAEPLNLFRVPEIDLNNGDNNFSMIFYPCPIQKRSQYLNPRGDPRNQQFLANVAPIFSSFKVNFRSIVTDDGNIWVSPDGRANGAGTRENPMDIRTAIAIVAPGQTIMMMDGIYTPVEPPMLVDGVMRIPIRMVIPRFNSGRPNPALNGAGPTNPGDWDDDYYKYFKRIKAENRNKAIFDFQKGWYSNGFFCRSFELQGDYWWLEGMHFRNAYDGQKGIVVMGSNIVLSWVKAYFNGDTGIQISGRNNEPKRMWPSNVRVQYSESFGNADDGITNADGFAAKLTVWEGVVFYRCIAHHNIDDGWDLFAKKETGPIGAMLIEESFAYANGRYLNDEMAANYPSRPGVRAGYSTAAGGNGFKMGGEGIPVLHHARNSLAFWNDGDGFTSNSDPAILLTHCTAVDNYNRVDTNPGSNFAVYSASSASFEGLDAIINQVVSWWTPQGPWYWRLENAPIWWLKLEDGITDRPHANGGPPEWYDGTHAPWWHDGRQRVVGRRGDRLEPRSPAAGYVWRNYIIREETTTNAVHALGRISGQNARSHGTLNTETAAHQNTAEGRSVSSQFIVGKWIAPGVGVTPPAHPTLDPANLTVGGINSSPIVSLRDSAMVGWNRYIEGRHLTKDDFVDPTFAEPPFYKEAGVYLSPWEPLPGEDRIPGRFFEVWQGDEADMPFGHMGLPKLGNFMRLNNMGGITPGIHNMW